MGANRVALLVEGLSVIYKALARSPAPHKMICGVGAHACHPGTQARRQEDARLEVMSGYTLSSRPAWAIGDPVFKKRQFFPISLTIVRFLWPVAVDGSYSDLGNGPACLDIFCKPL